MPVPCHHDSTADARRGTVRPRASTLPDLQRCLTRRYQPEPPAYTMWVYERYCGTSRGGCEGVYTILYIRCTASRTVRTRHACEIQESAAGVGVRGWWAFWTWVTPVLGAPRKRGAALRVLRPGDCSGTKSGLVCLLALPIVRLCLAVRAHLDQPSYRVGIAAT